MDIVMQGLWDGEEAAAVIWSDGPGARTSVQADPPSLWAHLRTALDFETPVDLGPPPSPQTILDPKVPEHLAAYLDGHPRWTTLVVYPPDLMPIGEPVDDGPDVVEVVY
jgi:hypothetical protein